MYNPAKLNGIAAKCPWKYTCIATISKQSRSRTDYIVQLYILFGCDVYSDKSCTCLSWLILVLCRHNICTCSSRLTLVCLLQFMMHALYILLVCQYWSHSGLYSDIYIYCIQSIIFNIHGPSIVTDQKYSYTVTIVVYLVNGMHLFTMCLK